jgi:hypothetical protein
MRGFLIHGTPNKALKLSRHTINLLRRDFIIKRTCNKIVFKSSIAKILIIVIFKNNVGHGFRLVFCSSDFYRFFSTFPSEPPRHIYGPFPSHQWADAHRLYTGLYTIRYILVSLSHLFLGLSDSSLQISSYDSYVRFVVLIAVVSKSSGFDVSEERVASTCMVEE